MGAEHSCRFCGESLSSVVLDLGMSPLPNALIEPSNAAVAEPFFPLRAFACEACWLVQLPAVESPETIFGDYTYFSSYSTTWLEHSRRFARSIVSKLGLGRDSLVIEIASNDGYLLKHFREQSIPVLGVEPARNVARAAESDGIPTVVDFFGTRLARTLLANGKPADLVIANNVLAHVPDLNDFVAGIALLLKPGGTASIEFPHLLRTVERGEFDTVYHEHFSYFSLNTAQRIFSAHGLSVVGVEELPTHGGSLRVYVRPKGAGAVDFGTVESVLAAERAARLDSLEGYAPLETAARRTRQSLRDFLMRAKRDAKSVAGYGAPAKATTLLNYCGVGTDLLAYTVDRSPRKQGRMIPGVRVPIEAPRRIFETKPDYVLILPWNIEDEIREQMAGIAEWGGQFVVPIPDVAVVS